jgi:c-di-GMP-binding flagellar brake protein YcgR
MEASDYLINLPEHFPVAVNVTTTAGDTVKLNGTGEVTEVPSMRVRFAGGALPDPARIDMDADCLVFIETGEIVTLICTIEPETAKDSLSLSVRELIQHAEKREIFRGPAGRLQITFRHKAMPETRQGFSAKGVNISCGGILLIIPKPVEKREKLLLEIYLPDPVKKTITCEATVLRINPKKGQERFVAVKFADLDSDMCDDIMAFCFAEQRRLLREQVTTRDL